MPGYLTAFCTTRTPGRVLQGFPAKDRQRYRGQHSDPRLNAPGFQSSLLGQIDWVETVNRAKGQKLREQLAVALQRRALSGHRLTEHALSGHGLT